MFFGRKQEITEYLGILDTLRGPDRSQVLVISGASGSGKSSLLRAGLIPRLRRKPDWVVISPFEVAREPVRNLLDRLGEALAGLGISTQGLDLTKPPDDPTTLAQTLDEALRRLEQAAERVGAAATGSGRSPGGRRSGRRATRPGCCSMRWPRFLASERGMSLSPPRSAPSSCPAWRRLSLDPRCGCGKHR